MSNLNVLPFYKSVDQQNHRKDYAFGEMFSLITPIRNVLPFQIVRETSENEITLAELYDVEDNLKLDILDKILLNGLQITPYTSYDVISYTGLFEMDIAAPEGRYYLKLSDGENTWFSDVFTTVLSTADFLKIEYWNIDNLPYNNGELQYLPGFKFDIYLPTQLGRPEYVFEEDVTRRDGYSFIEKQVSYKNYKFNFIAPEYLCDALRVAVLSDSIRVINKRKVYLPDSFLMSPTWQDGGLFASVEVEFVAETILKRTGQKGIGENPGIDMILLYDEEGKVIPGFYIVDDTEDGDGYEIKALAPTDFGDETSETLTVVGQEFNIDTIEL